MSHTLTQPEEVEQVWKEVEREYMTPGMPENKTECVREGWHGDSALAYQVVFYPAHGGMSSRC
jgi:hypothetical protein